MSRPSLPLYSTFVKTFSSIENIFSKDKKVIVWKATFPYYLSNKNCDMHIASAYHFQANA